MCVPGCQEAVRQRALAARPLQGRGRPPRSPAAAATADVGACRAGAPVHAVGRSHPHHVARVSDLLRRAGDRAGEDSSTSRRTASISTGGASSSMPAPISMRRSISRKTASPPSKFRPRRSWCRLRSSMWPPRLRANPDYLSDARGPRRLGEEARAAAGRMPASRCIRAGPRHVGDAAKFTGKDAAGVFHFPGFGRGGGRMADARTQVAGIAVDTLSLDHGLSKDFKTHRLAAIRPLGARERRQSRSRCRPRAPRWWWGCQGEGRDRRTGKADCAGLKTSTPARAARPGRCTREEGREKGRSVSSSRSPGPGKSDRDGSGATRRRCGSHQRST